MTFSRIESRKSYRPPQTAAPQQAAPVAAAPFAARLAFGIFIAGLMLRIFLTDAIINAAWPYTAEGGSFPGKIHPGSYLIFMACGLLYLRPGFRFYADDLPLVRAFVIFALASIGAALFPMLQGRNGPAGYVLDVYLVVSAIGIFVCAMPPQWRRAAGLAILAGLLINSLLSVGEFATGRYILPVEAAEFRPTAFLGAALNVGVINLTAMTMLVSLPLRWYLKAAFVCVLMMGLLISASRTALLVSLAALPLSLVISARLRGKGPSAGVTLIVLLVVGALVLPALYLGVDALGFLDRFKSGYLDDSAQTRIDIYRVFEFVGWKDILFGLDITVIRRIAKELLGIELIESAIVFFVFDFGAIFAAIFAGFLLWLLWRIARKSHPAIGLALLVFLGLALTNNTLSTKVPSIVLAISLAVCLRAFHSPFHGGCRSD